MTILVLEYMGLYFLQVSYKAFVYAVKLKCEVGILNRIADFVKSANGGGYGAAAVADNNNLLDDRDGGQRRFQNFYSFQLSSQVEREWETTLRNTFGVAMADEEKRDGDDDESHRGPLPSPSAALVAEARASSSGGSSGRTAAEVGRRTTTSGGGLGLLETFGRNSVGSLGGSDCGPAGRCSSASSGLADAADVMSAAGSSSFLERPRKGMSRPHASHLSGS